MKLLLIFFVGWLYPASRHDFHTSLAQMNYNPDTRAFEVSLRVFTDDLEAALAKAHNQPVSMGDTAADKLVQSYVIRHFALLDKNNRLAPATYVGKELEVDVTWIYLEIRPEGSVAGMRIQNSVLMELFDDQINIVNLTFSDEKRTYVFKPGKETLTI